VITPTLAFFGLQRAGLIRMLLRGKRKSFNGRRAAAADEAIKLETAALRRFCS